MFNIYSYEKKLKQEEEEAKKKLKKIKVEEQRKSKKLNYEVFLNYLNEY